MISVIFGIVLPGCVGVYLIALVASRIVKMFTK